MEAASSSETTEQTHATKRKNKNIYLSSIRYGRRETYKVTLSLCLGENKRWDTGNWKRKHWIVLCGELELEDAMGLP